MSTPLLFILTVLIWGSTFLVIKMQLGEIAPAVSVVYRFGIGTLILFSWCAWHGKSLHMRWRRQPWLILQGFFNFGLTYICTYEAEGYLVSALVAVLFALMIFWNAVGARIFFGTRLSLSTLCAAALSISGVLLLFSHSLAQSWHAIGAADGQHFLAGLGLAIAATLSASAGNMVATHVGRAYRNDVFVTTSWAMFWGMASVSVWVLVTGKTWQIPASPLYWTSMVYLALFGSVIAFTAYFTLINRIGPGKAAYTGIMTPVVSVLLSMRFEGYQPGKIGFAGMALCLMGVLWAIRGKSDATDTAARIATADLHPATGDHA